MAWTNWSKESLEPLGCIRPHVPEIKAHKFPSRLQPFGIAIQRIWGIVCPSHLVNDITDFISPVFVLVSLYAIYVIAKNTKDHALSLDIASTVGVHISSQVFPSGPILSQKCSITSANG